MGYDEDTAGSPPDVTAPLQDAAACGTDLAITVGEILDERYAVLGELGEGGMGIVIRAYDTKLEREVALKRILPNRLDVNSEARLEREAQAMAKLAHPNVVAVYDVVSLPAGLAIAMEYVKGRTLRSWTRRRGEMSEPHPWREVLDKYIPAGRGLWAAHRRGLVHRDFKPSNVLLSEEGDVKVTDFGLVKLGDRRGWRGIDDSTRSSDAESSVDNDHLTRADEVLGTPRYMAPEQHVGEEATAAADQFSYCVALREALCGTPPYRVSGSLGALAKFKMQGPPPWLSSPRIPRRIQRALDRGLSPDATDRWNSMRELLDELERAAHGPSRANRVAWVAIGCGVAGAAFGLSRSSSELCTGGPKLIEEIWSEQRRASLESKLQGLELEYTGRTWTAIEASLGAYTDGWAAAYAEACEATQVRGEQSQELMDLRIACLMDARIEVEARLLALELADRDNVERAHRLARSLPPLQQCADTRALSQGTPPPAKEDAEAVASISQRVATIAATRFLRQDEQDLDDLEELTRLAHEIAYDPAIARVELEYADALGYHERDADAERHLREGYTRALASGTPALQVGAALGVVYFATRTANRDVGSWAVETLEGLLRRHELPPELQISVSIDTSTFWWVVGDEARSLEAVRRGQELLPRLAGDPSHYQSELLSRLGTTLVLSNPERSIEHQQDALAVLKAQLGPGHPEVGRAYADLAVAQGNAGRFEDAEESLRRALSIYDEAGVTNRARATVLSNLASMAWQRGDLDTARELFTESLDFFERHVGPDHPDTLAVRDNLGLLQRAKGDYEASARIHMEVAEGREQLYGPKHRDVARSRVHASEALVALGRNADARKQLELASQADLDDTPLMATMTLLSLATLDLDERRDLVRARQRLVEARDRMKGLPKHGFVVLIELGLARASIQQNLAREALEHAEAARDGYDALNGTGLDDRTSPEIDWALARAHDALGHRKEAMALAKRSRKAWPKTDARDGPLVDEIDAWLRARSR